MAPPHSEQSPSSTPCWGALHPLPLLWPPWPPAASLHPLARACLGLFTCTPFAWNPFPHKWATSGTRASPESQSSAVPLAQMETETLAEKGSLSRPPGAHTRYTGPETHLEADTHPVADTPRKHAGRRREPQACSDTAPQHARRACALRRTCPSVHTLTLQQHTHTHRCGHTPPSGAQNSRAPSVPGRAPPAASPGGKVSRRTVAPLPSRRADTGAIVSRGAPRGRLSTASLRLGPSVGAEGWRLPRPTCSHLPTPDPASSRASSWSYRPQGA